MLHVVQLKTYYILLKIYMLISCMMRPFVLHELIYLSTVCLSSMFGPVEPMPPSFPVVSGPQTFDHGCTQSGLFACIIIPLLSTNLNPSCMFNHAAHMYIIIELLWTFYLDDVILFIMHAASVVLHVIPLDTLFHIII